jgi:hypothetical protein
MSQFPDIRDVPDGLDDALAGILSDLKETSELTLRRRDASYLPQQDFEPANKIYADSLIGYADRQKYSTLNNAVAQFGASGQNVALRLSPEAWDLDSDLIIPAHVHLITPPGVLIDGPGTLTHNGSLQAGAYQIFGSRITVEGLMKIPYVLSEWWGALPDGSTDCYAAILAAVTHINALTTGAFYPLKLLPGIYATSDKFQIDQDYFMLKGSGAGRAKGSTTAVRGGSAILYTGSALTGTEGILNLGQSGDNARGVMVEDLSIICQDNGIGISGYGLNLAKIKNVYIDQPTTGIYMTTACYSTTIEGCEIYDASVGGMDFRDNCHSTDIIRCAFNGDSTGSNQPAFGVRIGQDDNCSNVNILGCNFDQYKVARHCYLSGQDSNGFRFVGNYIECRDDGVTENALQCDFGDGIEISGNRITIAGAIVDYNVNLGANVQGASITGNYFSGANTSCIRVADGASDIFIAGNDPNGVSLLTNQNASTGKNVVVIENGEIIADSLTIFEKGADPSAPGNGECVIWMSDGSGKGDDGDVMIASNTGAGAKYATLFDYSAGSAW